MRFWISACVIIICIGLLAFIVFNTSPEPPPHPCMDIDASAISDNLADFIPTDGSFIQLRDDHFQLDGVPFTLRGVNYYPANFPWRRFLRESDMNIVAEELSILQEFGFNSLRIFLDHEALFDCFTPNPVAFERLDNFIYLADQHDLHLIVTLHDIPDWQRARLYEVPAYLEAQTTFILERYQNEPSILAWDLRNEGDLNYGSNLFLGIGASVSKKAVLDWLAYISSLTRTHAPHHLITAGWLHDAQATQEMVDFVSFHHWWDENDLNKRIESLQQETNTPILLEEVGYGTFQLSEAEQAEKLLSAIQQAEDSDLLGWMIWTAFDFPLTATCYPSPCTSADNIEHHFGIWHSDYSSKQVIEQLKQVME